jgi:alpha-glucosidase
VAFCGLVACASSEHGGGSPASPEPQDGSGDQDTPGVSDAQADTGGTGPLDGSHDTADDAGAELPFAPDADEDAAGEGGTFDATDSADTLTGPEFWPHCPGAALPSPAGATWDGAALTVACSDHAVVLEAFVGGVLRSRTFSPGAEGGPAASRTLISLPAPALALTGADGANPVLCTAELAAVVRISDCSLQVLDASGHPIWDELDAGAWGPATAVRRARAPAGVRYLGLGEKTGALDKRGQKWVFWNTDAYDSAHGGYGPGADPLYMSIPWLIAADADRKSGVFFDDSHRIELDLAHSQPETLEVRSYGGRLDMVVFAGPALADVVTRFVGVTGKPALPPRWALGFHQCRWGYTPDDAVMEVAAQLRARKLPADSVWLDIQHMDGFRTFSWDSEAFPAPATLISELAQQGFKTTVIADPGIKVDPGWAVYDGGVAGDHFLRYPNGQLYVGVVWPGDSVFPDFSRPSTRDWWRDWVSTLLDLGVRGVWLDVNEPTVFPEGGAGQSVPNELPVYGDGVPSTMAEFRNRYAMGQAAATAQAFSQHSAGRRPFVLSRAGFAGIQQWAAKWTGDVPSTWHGLRESVAMQLGLSLSGVSTVGTDVGGYSGFASPELYARWMALGSLSPFFRAHVTNGVPGQEPWKFGVEVEDISRGHIERRYSLLPYFYSLAWSAHQQGAPMLRPLEWHAPEASADPAAATARDSQFFVGPHLLAAPVLTEGAQSHAVYLPKGRWFEFHSDAAWDGPGEVVRGTRLADLPLFFSEGAIVPRGPVMQFSDQAPLSPLTIEVLPGAAPTEFVLYEDAGDGEGYRLGQYAIWRLQREPTATGSVLRALPREGAFVPPARPVHVRFRRIDFAPSQVRLDGTALSSAPSLEQAASGAPKWHWSASSRVLTVVVPDTGAFELEVDHEAELESLRPLAPVTFRVTVPQGTPQSPPVHLAADATGWVHTPMAWIDDRTAEITVNLPRGEWFEYKYTRGDWCTVEKWPACEEATNRYGFGAPDPVRQDTVWQWRDVCDPCP